MTNRISAWESNVVICRSCKRTGCTMRVSEWEDYCCDTCRTLPEGMEQPACGSSHHPDCTRLSIDTLKRSWWEKVKTDKPGATEESDWLIIPPAMFVEVIEPAPVVLYLCGDGHVDKRQDFLSGNIDLLLKNETLHRNCSVVAPIPLTTNGLLRENGSKRRAWDEDAVWAAFTEVLQRLGPSRVDSARLCATGISLGAAGVWHLGLRYGDKLAAVVPISGRCEWPGDSWPWESWTPSEEVMARLRKVHFRVYQVDVDNYAGNPRKDIECLTKKLNEKTEQLALPGLDVDKTCSVRARRWEWGCDGAAIEYWEAAGPLTDWTAGLEKNFNDHLLYYRVYTKDWELSSFLLQHSVDDSLQLHL